MLKMIKSPCGLQQLAHRLADWNVPVVPQMISLFIRFWFACWFPHTVTVGKGTTLGYGGLGCVIHSNTVLGENVHIAAGVLIGTNGRIPGTPVIEDNVYIGHGAVIMGPITVGRGSVIGASAVVMKDVPAGVVVAGVPARILREGVDAETYIVMSAAAR